MTMTLNEQYDIVGIYNIYTIEKPLSDWLPILKYCSVPINNFNKKVIVIIVQFFLYKVGFVVIKNV